MDALEAVRDTRAVWASSAPSAPLEVRNLQTRFGARLIQENVSFRVARGTVFAIMGVSGCGKSTLLRHILGLLEPAAGQVLLQGIDFWGGDAGIRHGLRSRCGVLFQSAALWSSMTILQNVILPLEVLTGLDHAQRRARALEVLAWVEMEKFAAFYPADLSGGMKKRAGLARAIVAEPPLLLLDEPSAGLDPISSRRLDLLILEVRKRTGAAIVIVSHELPSLLAIADDGIFLDADSKRPIAHGRPADLLQGTAEPTVRAFLQRQTLAGGTLAAARP